MSSSSTVGTVTFPLTTFFTPPGWCSNLLYTYQTTISGVSQFIRDADGPGNGRTSSCYPPQLGAFKTGISPGIYSPGVCPSGWHAKTIPHSLLSPTVSWSMCCPSGFTANLYTEAGWSCQSTVTTPTTVVLAENTFVKTSGKILLADWPIFIAWQSSDLDRFTPASAPLLTAAPGAALSSTSSSPSRTRSLLPTQTSGTEGASASTQNEQLSMGSRIGVGVGVGVAILAVITVLVICLFRRKSRRQIPQETSQNTAVAGALKNKPSEIDSLPIFEGYEAAKPGDPYHPQSRIELPTGWHGHEM